MRFMDTFIKICVCIGVPSIVVCLIFIGKKLQVLEIVKENVEKIKGNVKVISDCLVASEGINFEYSRLKAYSPLGITDIGRKHLLDISFIKIYNDHKTDFFDFIDKEKPTTKYDVELNSMRSIIDLLNKDYFAQLKAYLYSHPNDDLKSIIQLCGVYVRDKYLEEHKEIIS